MQLALANGEPPSKKPKLKSDGENHDKARMM